MIPLLKLVSVPFLLVRWSLRREHPRKKMSEGARVVGVESNLWEMEAITLILNLSSH